MTRAQMMQIRCRCDDAFTVAKHQISMALESQMPCAVRLTTEHSGKDFTKDLNSLVGM
jgi:hypothetical protein